MLKCTYCYLLFFFFIGLSFVFYVFDLASLFVFTVSLTRPGNFECIARFVDLKTLRAGSSNLREEGLWKNISFQLFSPEDLRHVEGKNMLFLTETLVYTQQSHSLCFSAIAYLSSISAPGLVS